MAVSYKDSGVNLEAAEESTKKIAALAKSTFNENVLRGIGLFSGFYEIDIKKYPKPVMVSSIDGVGTKLKVAFMMGIHNTVGQCLVNHCINDIMVSGADPLSFLDYIGTIDLQPDTAAGIVEGMAIACKENGVALIGGETAEMPGFYSPGEYDLAGCILGVINKDDMIDGSGIEKGDVLIGLPSNGLHTNGYSLARKVLFDIKNIDPKSHVEELGASWGETLLKVHKSYLRPIKAVRNHKEVVGISHITGGGIVGNTKRLLRDGLALEIDWDAWDVYREFQLIQEYGEITDEEMRRAFNLGIGLIFVVKSNAKDQIVKTLEDMGEVTIEMGKII